MDMVEKISHIIDDNVAFTVKRNLYHFITDEDERPAWSVRLNDYFTTSKSSLYMKRMYNMARLKKTIFMDLYFKYITQNGGVIIDLASGPSGYFAPVFEYMDEDAIFVVTDACPIVLKEHQRKCTESRFALFDVDLDKKLPIKNNSISSFSGNYISNVDNLRELIGEVGRCLVAGGRFAVKEIFYEEGSESYIYLKSRNAANTSQDEFIDVCKSNGMNFMGSLVNGMIIGKISEGDLFPIGSSDKGIETILFFEKTEAEN